MSKVLENMVQEELLQAAKRLESENRYLQFRLDQLNRLLCGAKRESFVSNETHGKMLSGLMPKKIPLCRDT